MLYCVDLCLPAFRKDHTVFVSSVERITKLSLAEAEYINRSSTQQCSGMYTLA